MLEELNDRLTELRSRRTECERVRSRLKRGREEHLGLLREIEGLKARVEKEEKDVARLEGMSITALFASFLGDKKEKLRAEQKELLAAKLAHDQAIDEEKALKKELALLEHALEGLEQSGDEFERVLAQKVDWIEEAGRPECEVIFQLSDEKGRLEDELVEIKQALRAGNWAGQKLADCQESLSRAKNWGVFDLVGGGLIATAVKHSHMDKARGKAQTAQRALSSYHRELSDVVERRKLSVDLGSLGKFSDYFFDGLIVDWMVQSRINQTTLNVARTKRELTSSLRELERQASQVRSRIEEIDAERTRRIEEVK